MKRTEWRQRSVGKENRMHERIILKLSEGNAKSEKEISSVNVIKYKCITIIDFFYSRYINAIEKIETMT